MDLVSTLIENNLNQAISLNKILVKNETQLNSISQEQKELETKNSLITLVLNSWSGWWNRVWSIKSSLPREDTETNKINLLDTETHDTSNKSTDNNHVNKTDVKSTGMDKNLNLLSEMANTLSRNLDLQNEMLDKINQKNISLETHLRENQNKIDKLL